MVKLRKKTRMELLDIEVLSKVTIGRLAMPVKEYVIPIIHFSVFFNSKFLFI